MGLGKCLGDEVGNATAPRVVFWFERKRKFGRGDSWIYSLWQEGPSCPDDRLEALWAHIVEGGPRGVGVYADRGVLQGGGIAPFPLLIWLQPSSLDEGCQDYEDSWLRLYCSPSTILVIESME